MRPASRTYEVDGGSGVPVLRQVRLWECPACSARHRTVAGVAHTPLHACSAMGGLQVPYQEADRHGVVGARLHLRAVQRGDMSNGDELPNKAGVMAVHAVRPDGSHDTYAYAPTARSVLRGGA